jgi:hypothetical protein
MPSRTRGWNPVFRSKSEKAMLGPRPLVFHAFRPYLNFR